MPRKAFSCIETLNKLIDVCTEWKRHIEEKTEMGKKLEEEFVVGEMLKILFDMF